MNKIILAAVGIILTVIGCLMGPVAHACAVPPHPVARTCHLVHLWLQDPGGTNLDALVRASHWLPLHSDFRMDVALLARQVRSQDQRQWTTALELKVDCGLR